MGAKPEPKQASEDIWPKWSQTFISDIGSDFVSFPKWERTFLVWHSWLISGEGNGGGLGNKGPCVANYL